MKKKYLLRPSRQVWAQNCTLLRFALRNCSLFFALVCIFLFINFIGKEKMTMNVHLLQHLPLCVRQFGPLWSFSCFAFESLNGFLSGCIHGNRYIPQQVCFIIIKKFMNLSCSLLLRHILLQVKDIHGMKFKLTL